MDMEAGQSPNWTSQDIVHDIVEEMVQKIGENQLDGMAEEQESEEQREEDKIEPEAKIPKTTSPPEEVPKESTSINLEKGASTESSNDSAELDNIYQVKWIQWHSKKVPIVTQNSNGPCPMLAIANVLLLRGKMKLQDGCEMISSEQLLEHLG